MSWKQPDKPLSKSRANSEVSLTSTQCTQPSQPPAARSARSRESSGFAGPSSAKLASHRLIRNHGRESVDLDREEVQDFDLGTFFNFAEWYGDDPYMTMCLSLFEKAPPGTVLRSPTMVQVLTRMRKDTGEVDESTMDPRDAVVANHVVFNLPTADEFGNFNWDKISHKLPIDRDKPSREARVSLLQFIDSTNSGRMSIDDLKVAFARIVKMPGMDDPEQMLDEVVRHSQRAVQELMLDGTPRKDDDILVKEFRVFLTMLQGYMDLWEIFYEGDDSGDDMLMLDEFVLAAPILKEWGMKDPALIKNPEHVFSQIDQDGAGYVTFGEFADFCVRKGLMEEVAAQFA